VAPELLGAPTIGGGSARPRGGGEQSDRSQISLPSRPKYAKTVKKQAALRTFWIIDRRKQRYLRNTAILKLFTTSAIAELFLFKVLEVIYAPRCPELGLKGLV
jgi:hypothetical protein